MNIIYCFDNNHRQMMLHSQESVLKHNPDAQFFYITEDKFGDLNEFTEDLCGYKHVSKACFLRFLIPKYFPDLDRALYLDCDIICKGSLSTFYSMNFENNYIIGCEGIEYAKIQAQELGIPFYVNSGVLLFNIPLMNQENYLNQIKDHWKESINLPQVFSADETIINYVFHHKIKRISEKYNYSYNRDYGNRICHNPVIMHFVGNDKSKFWESL